MATTYDWSPLLNAINGQTSQWGQRNQLNSMIDGLSGKQPAPNTGFPAQDQRMTAGQTTQGPSALAGINPQILQMLRNAPPQVSMPLLLQLGTRQNKYSQTPQYDQSGKAFVMDDQGNPKYLDGISARPDMRVANGTAYDPHGLTAGQHVGPAEAPKMRTIQRGLNSVEQQFSQTSGMFEDIPGASGPKFKPAEDDTGKGMTAPMTVEASDPKNPGQRTQFLAQQDKKTGQWYTGDQTRAPLTDVMLPGGVPGGGRAAAQVGRMIGAAKDVATALGNVSELPVSASTGLMGLLGGKQEAHTLWDATKTVLANKMSPQEVQSTKAMYVGIAKAIGTLDAGGLQTSDTFLRQIGGLMPAEGDTNMTKMLKLAELRQQADNALEAQLNGPLLSSQQKVYAKELRETMRKAIPWTPLDALKLDKSPDPNATIKSFAAGSGLGDKASAAPQGVDQKVWDHMTPQEKSLWQK